MCVYGTQSKSRDGEIIGNTPENVPLSDRWVSEPCSPTGKWRTPFQRTPSGTSLESQTGRDIPPNPTSVQERGGLPSITLVLQWVKTF